MADETRDEYKLFTGKRTEMQSIFDRMDVDEALYFLTPYKMMQLDGRKEMEDVVNITLNDPLLYVQKAVGIMGGASRQTVIEGRDLNDKRTTKIEEFLNDIFYMIDERLPKRKIPGLDAFNNEQICLRGRIGARICMRIDPVKGLIADVLPLDTRCYVDEIDGNDTVWAAAWFRQSKTQIEREYTKKGDRQVKVEAFAEVVDFWDAEKNVVFIDKQIVREQPNPYKYPPFVYCICPAGSSLNTESAIKHQGESILWANRELWSEKNRTATILQTLNVNTLFGALQYASTQGISAPKPGASPYKQKTVHPVEKGGGYQPMPINDIKAATHLFYSVLETSLQRGSLSAIDYGSLTFPLSNIAITQLTGSRNDIFLPRIQTEAMFYQGLGRMIIDQCIQLDQQLELGQEGSKNTYTKADLEGDYSINFQFSTKSKEQDIANLQVAAAARGFLPDDYIRREIMKVEDPDGMDVQLKSEQAEKVDEVLFLFRRMDSLLDSDKPSVKDQIEAYILAQRIVTILTQRNSLGSLSPIENKTAPTKTPSKDEILGLLNAGGGGNQGQVAPGNETAAPTEGGENA